MTTTSTPSTTSSTSSTFSPPTLVRETNEVGYNTLKGVMYAQSFHLPLLTGYKLVVCYAGKVQGQPTEFMYSKRKASDPILNFLPQIDVDALTSLVWK